MMTPVDIKISEDIDFVIRTCRRSYLPDLDRWHLFKENSECVDGTDISAFH